FDSLFNCLKKKITNPNITVNATHTVSADYYNGKKAEFTYQSVKSISNMRYASLNKLPVTLVDYYKFDISYYHLHATAENNAKVFLIDDEVDTLFAQYDYFSTHPDLIPKGKNFTLVFHRSNQTYKPHIYKDPLDGSGAQIAQDQVADTLKHILLPVAGKKFSDMLSIFSCLSKNSGYETSLEIIESFKNKVNSYRGQDGRIDMDRVMVDQSKNTGYCGPCRCIVM